MARRGNILIGLLLMVVSMIGPSLVYAERNMMDLSGTWQIQPGETKPDLFDHEVAVPGLVDLAKPPFPVKDERYFWYKKTFNLPADRKMPHAFIKIDQSQFGTEVYLNGRKLGGYIGCYTSHEYNADKAINYGGDNTLLVRVGAKETLSPDSAVGMDFERVSYIPGIWGDACLYLTDEIKIESIQAVPRIGPAIALIKVTFKNLSSSPQGAKAVIRVTEKKSGKAAGKASFEFNLSAGEEKTYEKEISISGMKLWSPETPFLYTASVKVMPGGKAGDSLSANFGMREFKIEGKHFYLNGKRIVLKGSNIAFHRFLSDRERGDLVWNEGWIKKLLVDIPKANNFNFFRNHIGQMYNRWYDIADEGGILLQDEWAFWGCTTGTKEQIRQEFTQWLKDNWNHPSIIIWDALNEPTYDYPDRLPMINFVRYDLIPEMKKLDPTRPWEPVDFEELHPYIYSFLPVLGSDEPGNWMNYIEKIKTSKTPVALNEYIYFWIDKDGKASNLTKGLAPRWLGKDSTFQQRLDFQAFLAGELTELWRRMDVDEIAPFVYLSVNEGATSHWFMGNIKDLNPKPILGVLKNSFSPLGVSVELWDRHFYVNEDRKIDVYVFNGYPYDESTAVYCRIISPDGGKSLFEKKFDVKAAAGTTEKYPVDYKMPAAPGTYYLTAEVPSGGGKNTRVVSKKIIHVFEAPSADGKLSGTKVMAIDPRGEISAYLASEGIKVRVFDPVLLKEQDILIAGEGSLKESKFKDSLKEITDFVDGGKTLIVIEPSFGIGKKQEVDVCGNISLTVYPTPWRGDESYVFPENAGSPLWDKLPADYLKMFNGDWGGRIVSAYDVTPPLPYKIEAGCGPDLAIPAVTVNYYGGGLVVTSRIQTRGRLVNSGTQTSGLYDLRPDPAAQQYLLNLLAAYKPGSAAVQKIIADLKKEKVAVRKVEASSVEGTNSAFGAIDRDLLTRWSSNFTDPQWIMFDLGEIKDVCGITLCWETGYAKEYQIQVSDNSRSWNTVFYTKNSDGNKDFIRFQPPVKGRYVRMYGLKRATDWGYSLFEVEIFTDEKELPSDVPLQPDKIVRPIKPVSAEASSVQSGEYEAAKAVDGDISTRWSSRSDSDAQWLKLDFGGPKEIDKVVLNWEAAFAKSYKIQVSDDNTAWKDIFSTDSGSVGMASIELKEPVKARYIRFLGIKRGAEWGYSLWEFETYGPSR